MAHHQRAAIPDVPCKRLSDALKWLPTGKAPSHRTFDEQPVTTDSYLSRCFKETLHELHLSRDALRQIVWRLH